MKKIIVKKIESGYWPVTVEGVSLGILEHFLTTDVEDLALSWIEWLNDPEDPGGSANATVLLKDPDNPEDILLGDVLDDGLFDEGPYFTIKKNNLIELLKKWDELYKQGAPYIVITIDDHQVHIEGKDSIE